MGRSRHPYQSLCSFCTLLPKAPASTGNLRGGHLPGVGHVEPGRRTVLEAGLRRLVEDHGRPAVGESTHQGPRPSTVLGRDGHRVRLGLVCPGPGYDELCHVHRLGQRGHAKQKRVDLRLVDLGLVVTRYHALIDGAGYVPPSGVIPGF